jgi:hypothetical protein
MTIGVGKMAQTDLGTGYLFNTNGKIKRSRDPSNQYTFPLD